MKEEEIKNKVLLKLTAVPLGIILIIAVWGLLAYGAYLLFIVNFPSLTDLCRLISS